MNILITGASGFLGSALANHFAKLNCNVSLLIRKKTDLRRINDLSTFEIGRCDSDLEVIQFISDVMPDVVIHTACSYGRAGESMPQIVDSNIRFGITILEAIKTLNHICCFINIATALDPNINFYALTKSQFVESGKFLAYSNKIHFINLVVEHFYGPGEDQSNFIGNLFRDLLANKDEILMTLGNQKRDFIFIKDLVDAILVVIEHRSKLDIFHELQIGSGMAISIRELTEILLRITKSNTKFQFGAIPYRKNEAMFSEADLTEIQKLGWSPQHSLEEGLRITWLDLCD